jgi:KUP system potassium uptake protein
MFLISIFGSTFLIGDGIVTASISVLSAMEAIETYAPSLSKMVIPMACLIHFFLFSSQKFGTQKVGQVFSPLLSLWLLALFSLGIYNTSKYPSIFTVFNPGHIITYARNIGFGNWFKSVSNTYFSSS